MNLTVTIKRGTEVEAFTVDDALLQQIAPGAPDSVWVQQITNINEQLFIWQLANVTNVPLKLAAQTVDQYVTRAS